MSETHDVQQANPLRQGRAGDIFRAPASVATDEADESPIIPRRARSKKLAIVLSSPDKSGLQSQPQKQVPGPSPEEDESVVLLNERPGLKRLRRGEDQTKSMRPKKSKRGPPQIGMFLDTAAVNSDNEDTASDTDEEVEPET